MKQILYLFAFLFSAQFIFAQVTYKNFNSEKLREARDIKIQLPRSYDSSNKSYPIIVVLDGDYMFELVSGNVEFASYWEDIPEAIVVGINQLDTRDADNLHSGLSSLPIETGAAFFEFIGTELIPYIEKTYRTEKFRVAIGHGSTANFINYYLLKQEPLFNAYVTLSPDLAPQMGSFIKKRLSNIQSKTFYYLATASNDVKGIKEETEVLIQDLKNIDNVNLLSAFDNFEGPTHYSMPAQAIPKALESIFFVFRPISKKEYKETILKLNTSPVDYLTEKYLMIKNLFGIDKTISINDFRAIAAAINKLEKYEAFEPLGKLARKEYPDTLLGNYYLGRFYEETGDTKKAMKVYQSAYMLEEIGGVTKDHVLELSEQIKIDFGY